MQQEASLPQKFTRDYPTLRCSNATRSNGGRFEIVRPIPPARTRSRKYVSLSLSLQRNKQEKTNMTKRTSERSNRASHPTVASSSTTITVIEDEFIMTNERVAVDHVDLGGEE